MLIKLGFWTPVLFFLTLKSGFPETSSQLTPSSSGESGDRTFGSGRWTVTTVQHQRFANRKPSGESDEQSAEQLQEVSIAKRG